MLVSCPTCRKPGNAPNLFRGETVSCQWCGQRFLAQPAVMSKGPPAQSPPQYRQPDPAQMDARKAWLTTPTDLTAARSRASIIRACTLLLVLLFAAFLALPAFFPSTAPYNRQDYIAAVSLKVVAGVLTFVVVVCLLMAAHALGKVRDFSVVATGCVIALLWGLLALIYTIISGYLAANQPAARFAIPKQRYLFEALLSFLTAASCSVAAILGFSSQGCFARGKEEAARAPADDDEAMASWR